MVRKIALTLGPVLIVAAAHLLYTRSHDTMAAAREEQAAPSAPSIGQSPIATAHDAGAALLADCRQTADGLVARLGPGFAAVIHPPFVVAGDLPRADLERHHRETIVPAARALCISYFDRSPSRPVTIILVSGEAAYQRCAERLDGQKRAAFAGYYERGDRRMVLNVSTGDGTIAHELTHALAHFDYPQMPEWFDEGLASLHEEAHFTQDGLRIVGDVNWRGRYLVPAIQMGELQPLESLIRAQRVRPDQQAIDYAHARYFCLFLQERGLLEAFYRKCRAAADRDPSGLSVLHELLNVSDLSSIDDEFCAWAVAREKAGGRPPGPVKPAASERKSPDRGTPTRANGSGGTR